MITRAQFAEGKRWLHSCLEGLASVMLFLLLCIIGGVIGGFFVVGLRAVFGF